jgi:hypothetical protein
MGEGMKVVELTDLGRLKERDLLWFGKETYAIRRHKSMTISFPLNEVKDELRDLRGCAKITYQSMAKLSQLKLIGFVS